MYGENTKTIAIPIYRVLPYPVISVGMEWIYIYRDQIHGRHRGLGSGPASSKQLQLEAEFFR